MELKFKFSIAFVTLVIIIQYVFNNICRGNDGGILCCIGYKWNNTSKECIPCTKGYTGNSCDTKCTFPSYGHDCQMTCDCQKEDCNFISGCSQSLDVSSVSYNYKSVDAATKSFTGNITNSKDNFKTAFSVNDDNANYKQCNSTATKSNKSNSLMHATIGLAIVAILIIFIYIYTHLLKRYQIRSATV